MDRRAEIVRKVLAKVQKLKESEDLGYANEYVKISNKLKFEIHCDRYGDDTYDKDKELKEFKIGTPLGLSLTVLEGDESIDGVTWDFDDSDNYEKDINYLIDCTTNWD